ncbi:MAG: methyltransferase domain-containing protein [Pyrinomonadaceae bacterium]
MNSQTKFVYDELPYPSFTFPETHPDRLATMATLFGVKTADPANCRMLELGCGDGTNLLSFAYGLPDSEFVGIDLSKKHIDFAKQAADELSLRNISFYQKDVLDLDTGSFEKFDFIIAHGLFSWVPDIVRKKVLEIYRDCLTPDGIGLISYNTLPGCRIRQITWDLMQFHTRAIDDPTRKVEDGKSILDLVTEATDDACGYQSLLRLEQEQIEERAIENVFHDDLCEINTPFYFYEIAAMLEAAGFQYLSESEPTSMNEAPFSNQFLSKLPSASDDIVSREQYLDFVKFRRFRSTIFCRSDKKVERNPTAAVIEKFHISSNFEMDTPAGAIPDDSPLCFYSSNRTSVQISHSLTKATLQMLRAKRPDSLRFEEIINDAIGALSEVNVTNADVGMTAGTLLQLFFAGFLNFHANSTSVESQATERPEAGGFARWQAKNGSKIATSMQCKNISLEDPLMSALISILDGKKDRENLVEEIAKMIEVPTEQTDGFRKDLPDLIEVNLQKLAESGLLVS